MNTSDRDDPVARRARSAFDAAVDATDAATANRLRLARRAALSATPVRAWTFAPLAGAAALALATWWLWPRTPAPVAPIAVVVPDDAPSPAYPLDAGPVVADDEAWALLDAEDAELYAWLADAPVAPDAPGDAL